MIKRNISAAITTGALVSAVIAGTVSWADSKPKIDSRAQQIESMESRLDALERRVEELENVISSTTDGK